VNNNKIEININAFRRVED